MAMRSQVYEWANLSTGGAGSTIRRVTGATPVAVAADSNVDIFIGGIGNNITKPAETTATQFVVIEDVSCSAFQGGAVQVRINTTDYFQNPDVTVQNGIPGQTRQITQIMINPNRNKSTGSKPSALLV